MRQPPAARIWLARALIGPVIAWNVQCAAVFMMAPGAHAPGFELSGPAGDAAVRGIGVLFLMWNVPYLVALLHPIRHRLSLYEALAMQSIGLIGESLILVSLPAVHAVARASLLRFIIFDAAGLVALILAVWLVGGARRTAAAR